MIEPTSQDPLLLKEVRAKLLNELLFSNATKNEELSIDVKKHIRNQLIPFVTSYISPTTNKPILPRSMRTYILALQRQFRKWGYKIHLISVDVFNNKRMGILAVCDNKFAEQQSQGQLPK